MRSAEAKVNRSTRYAVIGGIAGAGVVAAALLVPKRMRGRMLYRVRRVAGREPVSPAEAHSARREAVNAARRMMGL